MKRPETSMPVTTTTDGARRPRVLVAIPLFLCLALLAPAAKAQWTAQSITLTQGWNAVFLMVQPEPNDCESVFGSLPVEQVCTFHSALPTVQFVQDPGVLMPDAADWLRWYPTTHEASFANSLFTVDCGKPYLVKIPAGHAIVTWDLVGKPLLKTIKWQEDAYNWVGFRVSASSPPTFAAFFGPEPKLPSDQVWRLENDSWVPASLGDEMRSGEAFWIKATGYTEYQGPLTVDAGQRVGLDYGISLMEDVLRLRNASSVPITVDLSMVAVTQVQDADPPRAGEVPLWWWDATNGAFGAWDTNGIGAMGTLDVGAGDAEVIRLAVSRREMDPFTPPVGDYGDYQSLLQVEGDDGSHILVPVHALGLVSSGHTAFASHTSQGLWVGNVTIGMVNEPIPKSTATNSPAEPVPVGPEAAYQFPVILHVDTAGKAHLLQHVNLMWNDASNELAIVAGDDRIGEFNGVALRDGVPVGRRISSAAFGFSDPLPDEAAGNSLSLRFMVSTEYDDLLNPFLHQYHPDHNNLTELQDPRQEYTNSVSVITTNYYHEIHTNEVTLVSTRESYAVARLIDMAFTDHDPEGLVTPGWGDRRAGGIWHETVLGLRHQPIHAEGVFRLSRISRQGTLYQ